MKVKELIEELQKLNQEAEISVVGNITNPEDDEQDIDCDVFEIWGEADADYVTLFFGLYNETDKV